MTEGMAILFPLNGRQADRTGRRIRLFERGDCVNLRFVQRVKIEILCCPAMSVDGDE